MEAPRTLRRRWVKSICGRIKISTVRCKDDGVLGEFGGGELLPEEREARRIKSQGPRGRERVRAEADQGGETNEDDDERAG